VQWWEYLILLTGAMKGMFDTVNWCSGGNVHAGSQEAFLKEKKTGCWK